MVYSKKIKLIFNGTPIILTIFSLYIIIYYSNLKLVKPPISSEFKKHYISFDNHLIKFISTGQKKLISNLIWIKALLDSDLVKHDALNLSSDSWLYHRIDTVTSLNPYFRMAYLYGAQYLSIISEDSSGASKLFKKGLKYFSQDYELNFFAGVHFLDGKRDIPLAIKFLRQASKSTNAPKYIHSLVAKLLASEGDLKTAFHISYLAYRKFYAVESLRKKYEQQLYALKAELDLSCLNHNKKLVKEESKFCDKRDFFGVKYKYSNKLKLYYANKPWIQMRPSFKKKKKLKGVQLR